MSPPAHCRRPAAVITKTMMMSMLSALISPGAMGAEKTFALGSPITVAEIRATRHEDRRLNAELDGKFESFGEQLPEALGQMRQFLLYQSEIVAEEISFHTQEGEDPTARKMVRFVVPWAEGKWVKTPEGPLERDSADSYTYSRTPPFYTAKCEGWVARLSDDRLRVIKLGVPGLSIDTSLHDFVDKRVKKRIAFEKSQQAKTTQDKAEQEKMAKAEALAQVPPFSLGSEERIADIRATFYEDIMSLGRPDGDERFDFKFYNEQTHAKGVFKRDVMIYRLSEIVLEDVIFKVPDGELIIEHDIVRDKLPWATEWTETTLKRAEPADPAQPYGSNIVVEVPLYTATRAGWVAKLYRGKTAARLVVVKLGVPGLNIDDVVPGLMQTAVLKGMEVEAALKARKAAKPSPFSLGSQERVAYIRAEFAEDSQPATPALSELVMHHELKYYKDKHPSGRTRRYSVVLDDTEIVCEDFVFQPPEGTPLTDSQFVQVTVPWASQHWAQSTITQASFSEAAQDYSLLEVPLYTATCEGGVAKLYSVNGTARLVVQKLGIPGLNIDQWVASVTPDSPPADPKSTPQASPPKIVKVRPRPPSAPQPFSLGDQERVAQIRKALVFFPPLPPLDKPDSGFEFYVGDLQETTVMWRNSLLHGSEIVAEEIYFRAPGDKPVTQRETIRTLLPWATEWTPSKPFPPGAVATDLSDNDGPLYTATTPGWVAKLRPFKEAARLIVVKQGIPGLTMDDWVTGYTDKVLKKHNAARKAEEEAKAKMEGKAPPPAEPPPFSLGSPERVAEIRKTAKPHRPMPPLDAPGSGFELYEGEVQTGTVTQRNTLLYHSEIVAEEIFFRTSGTGPLTQSETVRTIVPLASNWGEGSMDRASLPGPADKYLSDKVPTYTAIFPPGWLATLYPYKGGARLAVLRLNIPGLKTKDWGTSFLEKEAEKELRAKKAEEEQALDEKAAKAKP